MIDGYRLPLANSSDERSTFQVAGMVYIANEQTFKLLPSPQLREDLTLCREKAAASLLVSHVHVNPATRGSSYGISRRNCGGFCSYLHLNLFIMASVRTATHSYPLAEIDAMNTFYDGKKCVIESLFGGVEWSHVLDAALGPSNKRVSQSLILSCAMTLKMTLLAFTNAHPQLASGSISQTCR